MQSDTTTRLMLAGIMVGLAVLIVQNCQRPYPQTPVVAPAAEPPPVAEVYRNQKGRELTASDLVIMSQSVNNEKLPTDMRVWAALQLESIEHPDVSRALIRALDAEDEVLTTAVLQALVGNRDPRVKEAALRAAKHEDETVRQVAKYVLDSLEKPPR